MIITKSTNKYTVWFDGEEAGFLSFEIQTNAIFVKQLFIRDEFQRKGFASDLVNTVLSLKLPLTGIILTDYAAKFWSKFDTSIPVHDDDELQDWIDNYGLLEVNI